MTFDEVLDEMNSNQEPSESIRFMEKLRDIYAPTIEMTFEEHEYFKNFRFTDSSFTQLSESIMKQGDLVKFGLKSTSLYLMGLSEEQLMQAWLHPENIKVNDKEIL